VLWPEQLQSIFLRWSSVSDLNAFGVHLFLPIVNIVDVHAPSLEVFKARLDGTCNLV